MKRNVLRVCGHFTQRQLDQMLSLHALHWNQADIHNTLTQVIGSDTMADAHVCDSCGRVACALMNAQAGPRLMEPTPMSHRVD
jgi:hypothetical protein